jgi:hypothetical protein
MGLFLFRGVRTLVSRLVIQLVCTPFTQSNFDQSILLLSLLDISKVDLPALQSFRFVAFQVATCELT